jgi:hypothetical protein
VEGTELICALGINDLTTVNLDNDTCTTIINWYLVLEGEAVLGIVGNTRVGKAQLQRPKKNRIWQKQTLKTDPVFFYRVFFGSNENKISKKQGLFSGSVFGCAGAFVGAGGGYKYLAYFVIPLINQNY